MYTCCRCNQLAVYGTFCSACYHPNCPTCPRINEDIAELALSQLWDHPTPAEPAPALSREINLHAGMHICPGCTRVAIYGDICLSCQNTHKQVVKWKLRDVLQDVIEEADHIAWLKANLRKQLKAFVRQHDPITPARPIHDYELWARYGFPAAETNGARWQSSMNVASATTNISDPFVTLETGTDGSHRQSSDEDTGTTNPTTLTETDGTRRQEDNDWEIIQSGIEETRGRFQTAAALLQDKDAYWTDPSGDVIIP